MRRAASPCDTSRRHRRGGDPTGRDPMTSTTAPHRWRARAAAIACGGLVALLAACSATATGPPASVAALDTVTVDWVARLTGSNALVALVADGDQVVAYVCDGDIALGERFRGTLEDGRGQLRSQERRTSHRCARGRFRHRDLYAGRRHRSGLHHRSGAGRRGPLHRRRYDYRW